MMRATTLLAAVCAAAVGCVPVDDSTDAVVADMAADLPTSSTAVRVALFDDDGGVDDAGDLRAWPAWTVLDDEGVAGFALVGTSFSFVSRMHADVVYPAADVEFGAPPADVLIDDDDGTGTIAFPVVFVVAADVPLASVGTLGSLADDAPLGMSSYLGFHDGALQIETTDSETGEPSTFLATPVSTVGDYRAFDATLDAPYLMDAPVQ